MNDQTLHILKRSPFTPLFCQSRTKKPRMDANENNEETGELGILIFSSITG